MKTAGATPNNDLISINSGGTLNFTQSVKDNHEDVSTIRVNGDINGQGYVHFGGSWWAVSAAGKKITTKP